MKCYNISIIVIVISAFFTVTMNAVICNLLNIEASFSPAGLHSNHARIEAMNETDEPIDLTIIGSSIAGRLLAKNFIKQYPNCINIGMDGGGVDTAIKLFLESQRTSKIIIVELNALGLDISQKGSSLLNYQHTTEYKIRSMTESLSSKYRPSDVLYTQVKIWKDGRSYMKQVAVSELILNKVINGSLLESDKSILYDYVNNLSKKCERLIFITIPSNVQPRTQILEELSKIDSVEAIGMDAFMGKEYSFTDGVHMDSPSAKIFSNDVIKLLAKKDATN